MLSDWIVVMTEQPCKFTESHRVVHYTRAHFIVCKLYLSETHRNKREATAETDLP